MYKFLKITVCVLAVSLLATVGLIIFDTVSGGGTSGGGGGGASSGTKASISLNKSNPAISDGKLWASTSDKTISFKNAVIIPEGYSISVDQSALNLKKAGEYKVVYTLLDSSGASVNKFTLTVCVTDAKYSWSMLEGLIESKAKELGITQNMSKDEQVRKIYAFVNDQNNIKFKNTSNVTDTAGARANFDSSVYWIEEAIKTLSAYEGDCYSYYAVSKAFFQYFGIENVGIERDNTKIPKSEGTHFWHMVNIGSKSAPRWYYYDGTRLAGKFSDGTRNGCLMTLAKIQSYKPNKDLEYNFYQFNPSVYPTAQTEELG